MFITIFKLKTNLVRLIEHKEKICFILFKVNQNNLATKARAGRPVFESW